jgi:hypothetical protein
MSVALPEAGRYNVRSSFEKWLKDSVVTGSLVQGSLTSAFLYSLQFQKPIREADISAGKVVVCATDLGDAGPDSVDVDDLISTESNGTRNFGKRENLLMQIEIWGSSAVSADMDARILRMRDLIHLSLRNSGRLNPSTGLYIVPRMLIYDFTGSVSVPVATNNFLQRDRDAGVVIDSMPQDPEHPEWRAWRILARLWWNGFNS